MLRLAKAFWDLGLWRVTPAVLPASVFLLGLVAAVVAVFEVCGALLPPYSADRMFTRISLSVGQPVAWGWIVLAIAGRRQRFLQTASALLGVAALAQLLLYPLGSLLHVLGSDHPIAIPLGFLSFLGIIWYMLACAHIWRSALESSLSLGIAISLGYLLLSIGLEQYLLPDS
jgi:hypothetical protein